MLPIWEPGKATPLKDEAYGVAPTEQKRLSLTEIYARCGPIDDEAAAAAGERPHTPRAAHPLAHHAVVELQVGVENVQVAGRGHVQVARAASHAARAPARVCECASLDRRRPSRVPYAPEPVV